MTSQMFIATFLWYLGLLLFKYCTLSTSFCTAGAMLSAAPQGLGLNLTCENRRLFVFLSEGELGVCDKGEEQRSFTEGGQ